MVIAPKQSWSDFHRCTSSNFLIHFIASGACYCVDFFDSLVGWFPQLTFCNNAVYCLSVFSTVTYLAISGSPFVHNVSTTAMMYNDDLVQNYRPLMSRYYHYHNMLIGTHHDESNTFLVSPRIYQVYLSSIFYNP